MTTLTGLFLAALLFAWVDYATTPSREKYERRARQVERNAAQARARRETPFWPTLLAHIRERRSARKREA